MGNYEEPFYLHKQRVGEEWQLPQGSSTQAFAFSTAESQTMSCLLSPQTRTHAALLGAGELTERCFSGTGCVWTPRSQRSPSSPAQRWWTAALEGEWFHTAGSWDTQTETSWKLAVMLNMGYTDQKPNKHIVFRWNGWMFPCATLHVIMHSLITWPYNRQSCSTLLLAVQFIK